jgi:SAM-dependent methyltransferase
MRWSDVPDAIRLELLAWHAPVWKPLFDWGFDGLGELEGQKVLEVGCGDGGLSCLMAMCGAQVYSTDLQHARLKRAAELVRHHRLEARVHLFASDVYVPPLAPGTFDLVVTRSVLVLVDRSRVLPVLTRLMKPGAHALFVENLDGHPLVSAWRRVTGTQGGPFGYFTAREIAELKRYFSEVDVRYHGLTSIIAPRLGPLEPLASRVLGRVDRALLDTFPHLGSRAWLSAMRCRLGQFRADFTPEFQTPCE